MSRREEGGREDQEEDDRKDDELHFLLFLNLGSQDGVYVTDDEQVW